MNIIAWTRSLIGEDATVRTCLHHLNNYYTPQHSPNIWTWLGLDRVSELRDVEIEEVCDLSDAHRLPNTDHGTVWSVKGRDLYYITGPGSIIAEGVAELGQHCGDVCELGLLMDALDIDDPTDLGIEVKSSGTWDDDSDHEASATVTLTDEHGRELFEASLWSFGVSGCGEVSFGEANETGFGRLDTYLLEILKEVCPATEGYGYDGSNWYKEVQAPEEPLADDADDEHPIAIVRTAFHGGGVLGYATDDEHAESWLEYLKNGNTCTCGCFGSCPVSDLDDLPSAHETRDYSSLSR